MELSLNNISKKYKTKQALTDINITLHEGVYALLGPNGAGKSTLMNILVGLIPATAGEVLLDGKSTASLGADFRSLLGFLPQEPGFYPSFSGYDIMRYYADLKGVPDARQRINELLELVSLTPDKKRRVGQYSGGMKRRLGIAVALLNSPKILVMDEPSAGLDPEERMLQYYLSMVNSEEERSLVEKLYNDYRQLMHKTAYSILHNPELAEDSVHEAFLRVIGNIQKFSEYSCNQNVAYFVIIVRGIALNKLKRSSREADLSDEIAAPENIEESMNADIGYSEIVDSIKRLSPALKNVALLYFVQGCSAQEISQLLDISVNSVYASVSRARAALTKRLNGITANTY